MSPVSEAAVAEHMRLVRGLSRENQPLSSGGRTATVSNPRWYTPEGHPTPGRRALREELVARALARPSATIVAASPVASEVTAEGVERFGVADLASLVDASDGRPRAIVMAGPPGAGKSTVRAQLLGADAAAWMVIDADAFKDALIDRARRDGSYETWIKPDAVRELEAGGERFFPLEMSALLQVESGQLAQLQRNEAVAAGRDILIDTVLWNQANAQGIGAQLQAAGYAISVVDVEVPYELSMARVMARWEATYREAMAGRDERGGRWVPSEYARTVYGGPRGTRGPSLCESTARALAQTCPAVVSYRLFRAQPGRDVDLAVMLATPARLETQMAREAEGAPLVVVTPSGSPSGPASGSPGASSRQQQEVAARAPQPAGPTSSRHAVSPPDTAPRASAGAPSSTPPRPAETTQSSGPRVPNGPAQQAGAQRAQRRRRQERSVGREGPGASPER